MTLPQTEKREIVDLNFLLKYEVEEKPAGLLKIAVIHTRTYSFQVELQNITKLQDIWVIN